MNLDGNGDEDLPELNHGLREGNEGVKDGGVSGEANLLERDGSKANGIIENVTDGRSGALQAPSVSALQISQQQQSQNARVCWERFLHIRSLKVLLVENDDSTRHVVTALLRNCSYEVIEAANGIQAWKILEDLTNHIDLVLTEVVMPGVSGIVLLSKIMSHKTRKNVPVIMMSSHDSMGLVFKCLSKGAVDFLLKPIRKNELKNLWQHVWRRCHSSSGSGSESGTQTQKSVKSKGIKKSDNNSGSNDEDDDASVGLNVGDGSDNGSGTQSSWTKQAVEVDSPRPTSPWDQLAECPDSTCAQVIHSNAEISGNKHALVTAGKESCRHEEKLDNVAVGKDQQIGVPRTLNLLLEYPAEDQVKLLNMKQTNLPDRAVSRCHENFDKGQLDLNRESPSSNLRYDAAKSSGVMTNTIGPHMDRGEFEAPNRQSRISDIKNKAASDATEILSLEQSLKRLRGVNDVGTMVQDDRNVLRRSESSAFSRYNTASNANKASGGNNKSGSPCDTSLDVTKKDLLCENQTHSNGDHPNQCSNVGSNNIDMGSTTNNTCPKSVALKNKSAITSTVKCLHPPSTFRGDKACTAQQVASEKVDDGTGTLPMLSQQRGTHQELQIQLGSRHNDHHYRHVLHNAHQAHQHELQKLPSDHDDSTLKKMAAAAPHCGSSNMLGGPVEGNAGNYSINGSASGSNHGSNHGSNGKNGSSTAVNIRGTNVVSNNGIAGKSGSGDASGSGSGGGTGNGMDQMNKFAHREAALTKFRQKRKERCFRKKVRYQSRKKLAEQRPRVRGQFVRQSSNENTSSGTGS